MGGIFSSPKPPSSPAVEAGVSRREQEAKDKELREKTRLRARRRRMLSGGGIASGVFPQEDLQSPLIAGTATTLGPKQNPQG